MRLIKVISVIQPWAMLAALGEKGPETRSWQTKYRGELYIHASKKVDKEICEQEPFKSVLAKHGYTAENLPTGAIIAKCSLKDCIPIEYDDYNNEYALLANKEYVEGNEYHFGDYTPGRYAWILKDIEMLKGPIPAKGKLSIWEYDLGGDK